MLPKLRNASASTSIQIKVSNITYNTAEDEDKESSNELKNMCRERKHPQTHQRKGENLPAVVEVTTAQNITLTMSYLVIKKIGWGHFSNV